MAVNPGWKMTVTDHLCLDYTLRAEIAIEAFEDSGLVYFADQQKVLTVNHTCLIVLNCLKNDMETFKIIRHFKELYGVDKDCVYNDLGELIANLIDNEAISVKCSTQNERYRYKRSNEVDVLIEENGDRYLINLKSKQRLKPNPTGWFLWDKLSIPRTIADLVTCQYAFFKVLHMNKYISDTTEYCSDLLSKGFIEEVDSGFEPI